jgi:hypothetical protein
MASICRASYVPLSEKDGTDGMVPLGAGACALNPTPNTISEKHQPIWPEVDVERLNRHPSGRSERLRCLKYSFTVQLLFLACVVGLSLFAWSFLTCGAYPDATGAQLSSCGQDTQLAVEEKFISRTKPSSSPVLEVFQVYQPVLAPSGPTDQTIDSNGSSNTTIIGYAETSVSCTKLLMKYSFGFSYGHPFVGMFFRGQRHFQSVLTTINRQLHSAIMSIQSGRHELYCHLTWPTIRSTGLDVFWRYRSMENKYSRTND